MAKNFDEFIIKDNNSVLLVDGLNLCFRYKQTSSKDFSEDFVRTIKSMANSYKCSKIIVAADKGSSSYRKEIFPGYKGNREDLRAKQTEEEKEEFLQFIEGYEECLATAESVNIPVIRFDRTEADDIIAYICKHREALGIDNIWIVSSDRDLDLLVSDSISRFSHITRKETTINTWGDFYEFPVDLYITYKCLVGDKGDNVPGVVGIGPKRATQIIEQYGDVFDIYEAMPLESKYKYIQALNAFKEQLLVNVQLMDLLTYCEEAIGDNVSKIDEQVKEYLNE